MDEFLAALERARDALGFSDHVPVGGDPDTGHRRKKRAAVNATIALRALMPNVADSRGQTVQAVAMGYSRCITAGAHLVVLPSTAPLVETGRGVVAFADEPATLELVNPAPFARITVDGAAEWTLANGETVSAPEGTVTASPVPILRAPVNREELAQFAVSFSVPRRDQRDHGLARIQAQLMESLAMGLGRVLDAEILRAVMASDHATAGSALVVAARAATAGLRWGDLRGIIGTTPAAGSVAIEHGQLRALGVPAELAPDATAAVVGDWRAAAIFVPEMIDVIIDRTSAAGDLVVTAWIGAQAVVADPARFIEAV